MDSPACLSSDYGKLATIVGRYYAMDRDKRWERVKIAVEGLTLPQGTSETVKVADVDDAVTQIEESYKKDVTDEFLKPIIVGGDETRIKGIYCSAVLSCCRVDVLTALSGIRQRHVILL